MKKAGLNLNIQKTKIMASGPITSWEIDGETMETVSDFILGGPKITAGVLQFMGSQRVGHDWATDLIWSDLKITEDGDCSHEIKMLTPWKESYDQPR